MKSKYRALFTLAGAYKRLYLTALVCTALTVLITFAIPLVFSETLDVVLSDQPSAMPDFVRNLAHALGGRVFLRQNLWLVAAVVVVLNILNGLFSYRKERDTAVAGENIARDLRERLYRKLSYMPFSYHVRAQTGDLVQRCTSDVDTVRRFLGTQIVEAGRTVIMAFVALFVLFSRDVQIAWICTVLMPLIFGISFVYMRVIGKSFKRMDESEGKMSAVLQENLTGVRVVRAFGMQQREVEKFDAASADLRTKTGHLLKQMAAYWSGTDCLTLLQVMATMIVCIVKAVRGEITMGTMIVFTSYISTLIYPIRQLGRILGDASKSAVALSRINEVLHAHAEEEEPGALRPPLDRDIVFEHVSFAYPDGSKVLSDLCMTIPAGKTVALLGNTGSGKSTLVHLLQRLYEPTEGRITIGGVDIKTIDCWYLRAHIGLMLQEPFLYGRTVMGNLAIAASGASEEEVIEASRVAMADEFIRDFEKGYDTMIGERGVTLSGGQRQRVAIARTLLKDNDVLIFDDSLSAVDMETDMRIREELAKRGAHITTIIISHRVSTLCEADRIFVLENGHISAEGTHRELIEQDGLYRKIYDIQSALEDDIRSSHDHVAKEGA